MPRATGRRHALVGAAIAAVATCLAWSCSAPSATPGRATPPPAVASTDTFKTFIPYGEAASALAATRGVWPSDLAGKAPAEREASWGAWVSHHDATIRARLERGDEDSIVNLWQFGTSFTARPRISERDLAGLASRRVSPEDVLIGRLDDFVAALSAPSANERLLFARQVIARHGIDVSQPAGQDAARIFLVNIRTRAIAEHETYRRTLQAANADPKRADATMDVFATLYHDRGLSSDTSLRIDFALDQAIESAVADGHLAPGGVHRVAIVGPGLDFTDKAEGYDFYPQQTVQPFAVADSLLRHRASSAGLEVVTLDLSPRINHHIELARARAQAGQPYVLQLPLDRDWAGRHWRPIILEYWQRLGNQIGDNVPPIPLPSEAIDVRLRAVQVRPAVVAAIVPRDLNIVLERLEPRAPGDLFDLVVATNILVYYDTFEQRLALANIAKMLKPGGVFLTNYRIGPPPPMESSPSLVTTVTWDDHGNGDSLFWYRRR